MDKEENSISKAAASVIGALCFSPIAGFALGAAWRLFKFAAGWS